MKTLILTEGTETEIIYFNALIKYANKQNDFIVKSGKSSDPLNLLREAVSYKKENQSEAWIVLDSEIYGADKSRDRRLKKMISDAKKLNVSVALSKPCFEVWLLSHFDGSKSYDFPQTSKFFGKLITQKMGADFHKSDFNVDSFLTDEKLQNAIKSKAGEFGLSQLLEIILK